MKRRLPVRSRLAAAASCVGLFAGSAGPLFAQAPLPAPLPTMPVPSVPIVVPADAPPPIEMYYGTKKVVPKMPPAVEPASAVEVIHTPAPVVTPAVVANSSPGDAARTADAFIETLRDFRSGTCRVSDATIGLLNKVAERTQPAEPRQIILTNYATPASLPALSNVNAPWLNAPSQNLPGAAPVIVHATAIPNAQPTSASPNVVVIREPAVDSKTTPAPAVPASGITLTKETLIGGGIALCGVFLALMGWSRSGRREVVRTVPQPIIAPVVVDDPNSIRLQGQYNAGEIPQTAEKFEIGPSFHDEVRHKKAVEEQNNAAAVEFMLTQNLNLLAQLNPGTDPNVEPVVDHGGYALPAETHKPEDDEFTIAVRGIAAAG